MPESVQQVYTLYVGVQVRENDKTLTSTAEQSIQQILDSDDGRPFAIDVLVVTQGFDNVDTKVWVSYWTDRAAFEAKLAQVDVRKIWTVLGDDKKTVGIWREHFSTPIERLETNYASLLHKPGISQVEDGEFPTHNLTAYWVSMLGTSRRWFVRRV